MFFAYIIFYLNYYYTSIYVRNYLNIYERTQDYYITNQLFNEYLNSTSIACNSQYEKSTF
jgi:hypothetical protein